MPATDYLLRNGHVIDPANAVDSVADVRISGGKIDAAGSGLTGTGAEVIDCAGLFVAPGLVDLHAHLRSPGFEYKETIATGTAAAAAGGFTTVLCMPNTSPPLDNSEIIRELRNEIERSATVHVAPIGCISRGRKGLAPVDYDALAATGVAGFSDDGDSTIENQVMLMALKASIRLDLPVMAHCEDPVLIGGAMHQGAVSERIGVRGIPAEAEESFLVRDIQLAEESGGWLYALHVSTARGADMIRQAKKRGVHVTGEVMPHHLLMTDRWVAGERILENVDEPAGAPVAAPDPMAKVNPPLRTPADTHGLLAAVRDGTFDVIATDHAPHALNEKQGIPIEQAAFGMNGFEVALPLILSLVRAGHLTLSEMIRLMSWNPARLLNLPGGNLSPGSPADIVVFDTERAWTVDPATMQTKSPNTPLAGMTLHGKPVITMVGGEIRYSA
ncbi:dihydroorotase [soil metagenome]